MSKLFILVVFLFFTFSCYALPTPDVLIQGISYISVIFSIFIAAMISIFTALKNSLRDLSLKQQLTVIITSIIIIIALGVTSYHYYTKVQLNHSLDLIATYYRSDMLREQAEFNNYGQCWRDNVHIRTNSNINRIYTNEHTLYVNTNRLIGHHSAIPALNLGNNIKYFTHVYPFELERWLHKKLGSMPEGAKTSIVFYHFNYLKNLINCKQHPVLIDILKHFQAIYNYTLPPKNEINGPIFFTQDINGKYQHANLQNKFINFPVRDEIWIGDHGAINFPNIMTTLPATDSSYYISKEKIYYVVPYFSHYRSEELTRYYLENYFPQISNNFLYLDLSSSKVKEYFGIFSEIINNNKFMILGLRKHDWLTGLDFAYFHWERLKRNTNTFKYLGANILLAKTASNLALLQKNNIKSNNFTSYIKKISFLDSLSFPEKIFLISIVLKLFLLFISFNSYLRRYSQSFFRDSLKKMMWCKQNINLISPCLPSRGWEPLSILINLSFIGILFQVFPINNLNIYGSKLFYLISLIFLINIKLISDQILQEKRLSSKQIFFMLIVSIAIFLIRNYFSTLTLLILDTILILEFLVSILAFFYSHYRYKYFFKTHIGRLIHISKGIDLSSINSKSKDIINISDLLPLLFNLPETYIISTDSADLESITKKFTYPVIVRSSADLEDQETSSQAGFFTSKRCNSSKEVYQTIDQIQTEYQNANTQGTILIQRFIEPSISGVLFSSHPSNPFISKCEWCFGHLSDLVKGELSPNSTYLRKISSTFYQQDKFPLENIKKKLFFIALYFEAIYQKPVDIEWGVEQKSNKLYIFQVRPITKLNFSQTQTDVLKMLTTNQLTNIPFRRSEFTLFSKKGLEELNEINNFFSVSFLHYLYMDKKSGNSLLEVINNQLYLNNNMLQHLDSFRFIGLSSITLIKYLKIRYDFLNSKINEIGTPEDNIAQLTQFIRDEIIPLIFGVSIWGQRKVHKTIAQTKLKKLWGSSISKKQLFINDIYKRKENSLSDKCFIDKWYYKSVKSYDLLSEDISTINLEETEDLFSIPPKKTVNPKEIYLVDFLKEELRDLLERYLYKLKNQIKALNYNNDELSRSSFYQLIGECGIDFNYQPYDQYKHSQSFITIHDLEEITNNSEGLDYYFLTPPRSFHGILVDYENIPNDSSKKYVIFSRNLITSLVKHFDKISGIVCTNGGELSHLAIMAREYQLPILAGVERKDVVEFFNKKIEINKVGNINIT